MEFLKMFHIFQRVDLMNASSDLVVLSRLLINIFTMYRFDLYDEIVFQQQIEMTLKKSLPHIKFLKEYRLDDKNIVDFYFPQYKLAIEMKIKGQNMNSVYKQIRRYCEFDEVDGIFLLSSKTMNLPRSINNKKCFVLCLSRFYL